MAAKKKSKKIRITLVRSTIGRKPEQRSTVRSLGLRKLHQSVEKEATEPILGMVKAVSHLVRVEEV
ncbi:MAG: 50S ribosomal protein L30 [Spirochaetaceae bacterium]|jgi:large subunit ribosomal protein L30